MALSERSLRDLRKIADLDAKTEARLFTSLRDALKRSSNKVRALY